MPGNSQASPPRHNRPTPPSLALTADEWELVIRSLRLTRREADVVGELLQAKRDKQIASLLGMSVSTVRTHLRHVFAAQGVSDRSELMLRIFSLLRQQSGVPKGRQE